MVSIKLVFIFAISLVLVVIGIVVFVFIRSSGEEVISETSLVNGTTLTLSKNSFIKFNLDESEHNLSVNAVADDYINITLQSTIIKTRLNIGQTRRFDVDDVEGVDLILKLNNISDGKADLYLKKMCFENWTCGNWSDCVDSNQTRECTDLSNCGTEEDKPEEIQSCVLPCSEQGVICGSTEVCNGTVIDSVEGDCCVGKCEIKELEFISCGADIDCMISASEVCNPSNLTYSSTFTNITWEQTTSAYYKIRELEGEKCKFYKEILSSEGGFTAYKRQTLIDGGKTEAEVDSMEEGISNSIEGETGICRFSVYALKERLNELKDGNSFITKDELGNYECSGELVWIN